MTIEINDIVLCPANDVFYYKQFTTFPNGDVYTIITVKGVEHTVKISGYMGNIPISLFIMEIESVINNLH